MQLIWPDEEHQERSGGVSGLWNSCTRAVTHHRIAPELSHLSDPHGRQQGLPDLHLEHLAHEDLGRPAGQSAVVDDRPLQVVQQRLEMENQLEAEAGEGADQTNAAISAPAQSTRPDERDRNCGFSRMLPTRFH